MDIWRQPLLGSRSEGGGFQTEACGLINAEHEVHILNGLAYCTFQQVVDAGGDEQLAAVLLDVDERLVGVDHLFQVDGLVAVMGEGSASIEFLVGLDDILHWGRGLDNGCTEDASRKVATIGDPLPKG